MATVSAQAVERTCPLVYRNRSSSLAGAGLGLCSVVHVGRRLRLADGSADGDAVGADEPTGDRCLQLAAGQDTQAHGHVQNQIQGRPDSQGVRYNGDYAHHSEKQSENR